MRAVATTANVSRSTLYRHFANPAELQHALQLETLARAATAIQGALGAHRPALAEIRSVVSALVELGAELPLDVPSGPPPEEAVTDAAEALRPLAERLAHAAGLEPTPVGPWVAFPIAHLVETCLRAGWREPDHGRPTVERLFGMITDPLDRGLLLLDAMGAVIASNPDGRVVLEDPERGRRAVVRSGGLYEDGSPASADAHPISAALATGEAKQGIRGHHSGDGGACWLSIDVLPLRRSPRAELYGFVAVFTDVSEEKRFELASLRPPGALGATAAPLLDIVRVLDEVPPPLLPEQLIAEAMRIARGSFRAS